MNADYENLRKALVQATHRIIALENDQATLNENQSGLVEVIDKMTRRMDRIQDELDLALGMPTTQMSDSDIRANACGGTTWGANGPTPPNPIDRLKRKIGS